MSHEICTLRPMYSLHSSFMEQFSNFKLCWTIIMGKGKLTWPFSAHFCSPPDFCSPPAGSNYWSLVGSRNPQTSGGKWLRWFTRTRQTIIHVKLYSLHNSQVCELALAALSFLSVTWCLVYITICLCQSNCLKCIATYMRFEKSTLHFK